MHSYLILQNFNMQNDIKIIIDINCDDLDKYQIIQFVNGKVEVKKNDKKSIFYSQTKVI